MRDAPQIAVREPQPRFVESDIDRAGALVRGLAVKADLAGGFIRLSAEQLRQLAEWAEEKEAQIEDLEAREFGV